MADATSSQLEQALQNAVAAQQQGWTIIQAAATQGVTLIYSLDTTSDTHAQQHEKNVGEAKAQLAAVSPETAGGGAQSQTDPVAGALLSLNTVIMRESIFTIELAAVAMALVQMNRAATADDLALATQRLQTIIKELGDWSRTV